MSEPLDAFGFPLRLWIDRDESPAVVMAKRAEFQRLKRSPHLLAALRQSQEISAAAANPQLNLFA